MSNPIDNCRKIEVNGKEIIMTSQFNKIFSQQPRFFDYVINPPYKEKARVENFDVYMYSRVPINPVENKYVGIYVKEVKFLEGYPVPIEGAPGNKSPEREFNNYLKLKNIQSKLSTNQRKVMDFAKPLFCCHDYENEMSYIGTQRVQNSITLEKLISIKALSQEAKSNAMQTVKNVIQLLHHKDVLYRDVNPGNFLLSRILKGKCTLIDPEYALFRGDNELSLKIAKTGKSFKNYADEEVKLFQRYLISV